MGQDKFRYSIPLTVRFADLDVLQHLNHATYLTYMEQARITYVRDVCGWQGADAQWHTLGMILARAEVDYKLPIAFGDQVLVYVRTSRLGGKSFDLEYLMTRQRGEAEPEIAATAKTVMVAYDYGADATIPVPEAWREAMLAYEPTLS